MPLPYFRARGGLGKLTADKNRDMIIINGVKCLYAHYNGLNGMGKHIRTYSRETERAVEYLATQIRIARKERRFTEAEMAKRVGISRTTLQAIEAGNPKAEIGLVLELAVLLGVPIFSERGVSTLELARRKDTMALLPQSIRTKHEEIDDNF